MTEAAPNGEAAKLIFAPLSPDFARDPYPTYRALREKEGLHYFADFDIWLASRFEDVSAIVMDKRMVRSLEDIATAEELAKLQRAANWHDMPHHERFVQFSLLDSDGAVHDRLRKQVFKLFTPAMIAKLRDQIQVYVDRLIDGLADRGEIDFVDDLAAHVPGHIIGRLLGVPDEDCPQLRIWSENIVQFFDVDRSDARKKIAETNTTEFYEYLTALKAERERAPKDDLISVLIEAERAGAMNFDEFISTCMLILMAGHGSTIDVLGSGMHALLRFPEQMARLRSEPGLIQTGVQEMFRYESPLPFFHRHCAEDVEICGRRFERGTKFGLLYGAANRDPKQFDKADTFDIGRTPNRHLAFGGGVHFCLGNHLARLDMDIIFSTLLRRFPTIELVDQAPEYKRGLSVRGPKRLTIAIRPA
ncbi:MULTISPECIES: cytochrome P450 [unclassified Ensifer]|uniref:cytochrome P450 n=1 Tax=unclassified Ensifer TaxID=2633371 RepID=UPI000A679CD2|nr:MULTISPECIES: cytochrome P450 [unclassified Ensifer]